MKTLHAEKEALKKVVFGWQLLSEEVWNDFFACWQPVTYKRKAILTEAGETERYLYFVLDGVQRAYSLNEGQRETTLLFTSEGSFSGIADSFQLQQPSRYYLETVTPSRLFRLAYSDFARLSALHPSLERWGRIATARTLSGLMEWHMELMTRNAEDKFRVLLTRNPHVLHQVPHKYLASYIGLYPTTFSKLLATVRV